MRVGFGEVLIGLRNGQTSPGYPPRKGIAGAIGSFSVVALGVVSLLRGGLPSVEVVWWRSIWGFATGGGVGDSHSLE